MRSELVTIYRRSSPRTGKKYDSKLVEKRKLKFYLKRGYFKDLPLEDEDLDDIEAAAEIMDEAKIPEDDRYLFYPEQEIEPSIEDQLPKRKCEDLDEFERLSIKNDKRAMTQIAEIHNTTLYAVRKIKGRL